MGSHIFHAECDFESSTAISRIYFQRSLELLTVNEEKHKVIEHSKLSLSKIANPNAKKKSIQIHDGHKGLNHRFDDFGKILKNN